MTFNSGADMSTLTATVCIMDYVPDDDERAELMLEALEEFEAPSAEARCDVLYEAPDWCGISDADQYDAFLRDGAACLLVIYLSDTSDVDEYEDEDYDE